MVHQVMYSRHFLCVGQGHPQSDGHLETARCSTSERGGVGVVVALVKASLTRRNMTRVGKEIGKYSLGKKEGVRFSSNPLIFLVAGVGFEPTTFGL
jgi:hypothetical protein